MLIVACDAGGEALGCCMEEGLAHLLAMVKNRTPAECRAIEALDAYNGCGSPVGRALRNAIAECMKGAMIRELDRRLLVLKEADPAEFRREMDLQAAYLRGIKVACSLDEEDDSTGQPERYFTCLVDLYERRAKEASLINDRRLSVGAARHTPSKQKDFDAYAKGLCAMPVDVWEGGRPPPACVEKVLSAL